MIDEFFFFKSVDKFSYNTFFLVSCFFQSFYSIEGLIAFDVCLLFSILFLFLRFQNKIMFSDSYSVFFFFLFETVKIFYLSMISE